MAIWSVEAKELEKLFKTVNDNLPILGKEIEPLINSNDANVVLLYARRCLEVIVTELCETELKRPRKTEPLKGIIDKLNSEDKVPSHIITSMHSLNSLATFGAHPKDFDPEQVKPVLNNLSVVIKWYLKFKGIEISLISQSERNPSNEEGFKLNKSDISKLEKSIAILPFRNDSPDDENTYFINGIMEEILNNLQRIRDIRVISRTSVEQYRNQGKPIPVIARELGVNYIVEGSGQKYGNAFRLRAQLIMADHESHLWGESFQQKITEVEDIFNIQTKIAETIADELKAVITPEEKQLIEKVPTNSIEAYDAYLKGKFYWKKLTSNDLETALKYFELAKEKDPKYAPAYAGISLVWMGMVQAGFASPEDAGSKIIEPLSEALALDSTSAEVHYALAGMNIWVLWDWVVGESSFKNALELNPNHAEARAYYSHFILLAGGSEEEAMEQIKIALKLDPLNPLIKSLYGVVLSIFGRYDEAIQAFNEALKIEPDSLLAVCSIIEPLLLVSRLREGLEMGKLYYKIMGIQKAVEAIDKGMLEGDYNKSLLYLAEALEDQFMVSYYLPFEIAYRFVQCGNKDKALHWLEVGYESHDQSMPYLLCYPYIKDLGEESRYKEIARKMNLPYKLKY